MSANNIISFCCCTVAFAVGRTCLMTIHACTLDTLLDDLSLKVQSVIYRILISLEMTKLTCLSQYFQFKKRRLNYGTKINQLTMYTCHIHVHKTFHCKCQRTAESHAQQARSVLKSPWS